MKRVKAACICQTLHFMLKEDVGHDYAVKLVKEEVEQYKKTLERNRTQYKIIEETEQSEEPEQSEETEQPEETEQSEEPEQSE